MQLPQPFHEQLKAFRLQAGLTLRDVAEKNGPRSTKLSRAERGLRVVDLDLEALASCYGCEPQALTKNTDFGLDSSAAINRGEKLVESLALSLPVPGHGKWPFQGRLEVARKIARRLVEHLERRIDAHPFALELAVFYRDVWTDSVEEAILWMQVGALGFAPIRVALTRLGFRHYPVLCSHSGKCIGDVPLTGLYKETQAGPVVLVPQVTLLAAEGRRHRVDALVFLGRDAFSVVEVDGPGHDSSRNALREADLDLMKTHRLNRADVRDWNMGPRLLEKLFADFPRLQNARVLTGAAFDKPSPGAE